MSEQKDEFEYIKVEGPDVFFYCEVSRESIVELCQVLKRVERDRYNPIFLHIQSDGGDVHAGLGAMDFLRTIKSTVVTIAEGMCASAATFILLGGDERQVLPNTYLLIHQISNDMWGKYEDLKDEMKQCELIMKRIKKIYLRETSIPEKKLDRLLQRDMYLSARQCIKYNITK